MKGEGRVQTGKGRALNLCLKTHGETCVERMGKSTPQRLHTAPINQPANKY